MEGIPITVDGVVSLQWLAEGKDGIYRPTAGVYQEKVGCKPLTGNCVRHQGLLSVTVPAEVAGVPELMPLASVQRELHCQCSMQTSVRRANASVHANITHLFPVPCCRWAR